jgi:hypothetical protein
MDEGMAHVMVVYVERDVEYSVLSRSEQDFLWWGCADSAWRRSCTPNVLLLSVDEGHNGRCKRASSDRHEDHDDRSTIIVRPHQPGVPLEIVYIIPFKVQKEVVCCA